MPDGHWGVVVGYRPQTDLRWRRHAIITNVAADRMSAAEVEAHHRLHRGIPEDTIRALKNDYGMIHAPVQSFFGNWLYRQACALAHNVSL
jgi:hypothetical protein